MRRAYVTAPPARATRAPTLTLVVDEEPRFCPVCEGETWRGYDPLPRQRLRLMTTCTGCGAIVDQRVVQILASKPRPRRYGDGA